MSLAPRMELESRGARRPEAIKILSDDANGSLLQSHSLSAGRNGIRTHPENDLCRGGRISGQISRPVFDVFELVVNAPVG